MSDFDKEAERERLREKYERDQQKREATEKMSDLLLKGATMTNVHCDACGDPVFRYDGQEFCPTCEEVVTEDADRARDEDDPGEAADDAATDEARGPTANRADAADEAAEGATVDDATANGTTAGDSAAPADDAEQNLEQATTGRANAGESADADATAGRSSPENVRIDGPATGSASAGADAEMGANAGDASAASPDASAARSGTAQPAERARTGSPAAGAGTAGGDGVAAARESLVRTLVTHSRKAEQCDDPRRATDHLAAAREAAEALAALSY